MVIDNFDGLGMAALETKAQGTKLLYFLAGLAEGTETVAVYTAMCVWPEHFSLLALAFASLCVASAVGRIALAVRDLGMTAEEALRAATLGGANALRRDDIGRLTPGARADATILDAESYTDLIYRPGVPLIANTTIRGQTL